MGGKKRLMNFFGYDIFFIFRLLYSGEIIWLKLVIFYLMYWLIFRNLIIFSFGILIIKYIMLIYF